MLLFRKTAAHNPFLPARHGDETKSLGCFSLCFPTQIHLLPGQKTVVDFLLTVQLPEHVRGELRLASTTRPLLQLHAAPLGERVRYRRRRRCSR